MHFDDQAIRSGRDRGERQRGNERRNATRVTRIDDDRQMRFALEHGNGGDVERVPRGRLVGANTALT